MHIVDQHSANENAHDVAATLATYTDDIVWDDVTGYVEGEWAGIAGGGAPVELRILYLFELRDGLIAYENTWFDSAAVVRQVQAWKEGRA